MTEDRDEKLRDLNKPAAEYWSAMVKYFVLANAGGAVTVISFLGAAGPTKIGSLIPLIPLWCFFLGMVFAGFAIIGTAGLALFNTALAAEKIIGTKPYIPKVTALVLKLRNSGAWPELISFVLFILGGVSGLVFLGMLLTASVGTSS